MTPHELLALIIAAIAARWLWRAIFHPFAPCRWCKGKKTNLGSTRKRFGDCRHCGGSGYRQVAGSKTVHRAAQAARGNRKDKRNV